MKETAVFFLLQKCLKNGKMQLTLEDFMHAYIMQEKAHEFIFKESRECDLKNGDHPPKWTDYEELNKANFM